MEKILKSVAMAAGAGLALGVNAVSGPKPPRASPRDILDLEPLLDRIETLERRLERLPATTEIESRLDDLESRFASELKRAGRETLDACTATIDAAVARQISERLEPLQQALADHGEALDALRDRVERTDLNLQQLIAVIERLVERDFQAAPGHAAANGSFQDHLDEALSTESKPSNGRLQPWPRHPDA